MIYFYTQDRLQIVGATHVKMVPLDGAHRGEANILAKLDRDSVLLGTYSLEKARLILDEIYRNVDLIDYTMPEEHGCEDEGEIIITPRSLAEMIKDASETISRVFRREEGQ